MNQTMYPAAYPNVLAVASTDQDIPGRVSPTPAVTLTSRLQAPTSIALRSTVATRRCPAPRWRRRRSRGWRPSYPSQHPEYTKDQVRTVIESTAKDIDSPGWDPETGWGRIDAAAALGVPVNATVSAAQAVTPQSMASLAAPRRPPERADFYRTSHREVPAGRHGHAVWGQSGVGDPRDRSQGAPRAAGPGVVGSRPATRRPGRPLRRARLPGLRPLSPQPEKSLLGAPQPGLVARPAAFAVRQPALL